MNSKSKKGKFSLTSIFQQTIIIIIIIMARISILKTYFRWYFYQLVTAQWSSLQCMVIDQIWDKLKIHLIFNEVRCYHRPKMYFTNCTNSPPQVCDIQLEQTALFALTVADPGFSRGRGGLPLLFGIIFAKKMHIILIHFINSY